MSSPKRVLKLSHRNQLARKRRRRSLCWEKLEERHLLASDWSNVLQPLDVTGDSTPSVNALDALSIINELNAPRIRSSNTAPLPPVGSGGNVPPPFVDVDCDNFVTPLDVLQVINAINRGSLEPSWRFDETGGSTGSPGSFVGDSCKPRIKEGSSFATSLISDVVVPEAFDTLSFEFQSLQFDTSSSGRAHDAFEAALLDEQGRSLVRTLGDGKDAFFNVSEGFSSVTTSDATVNNNKVSLSLVDVLPGTKAKLVLRLVNNDGDTTTAVTVPSIRFENAPPMFGPLMLKGNAGINEPKALAENRGNQNSASASGSGSELFPSTDAIPGRPVTRQESSVPNGTLNFGPSTPPPPPGSPPASAPPIDSRGKEFWIGFPDNLFEGNNRPQKVLYISGDVATTGTVTIPGLIDPATTQPFRSTFIVNPGVVTVVELPSQDRDDSNNDDGTDYDVEAERIGRVERRGIHVVTEEPVTVYGLDLAVSTSDAFLALPVPSLGTEYINLGYENTFASISSVQGTQFLVVASQDNTQVTLAPGKYAYSTSISNSQIRRPNGTSEFNLSNANGTDIGPFVTDAAGTGSIVVSAPFDGYAGQYNLEFIDLATAAVSANFDEKINLNFPTGRESKVFSFDVLAGPNLYYDAIYSNSFPGPSLSVKMVSPSGEVIELSPQNDTNSFANLFGAPQFRETGKYYVLVIGENTGAFDFAFRLVNMDAAPKLTFGTTYSGTSDPSGRSEVFRFDATAGQVFFYDAMNQDRNVGFTVLGPGGQQVFSTTASDDRFFMAPETSTYMVVVDSSPFRPSSFAFRLLDLKSAADLPIGSATTINIASGQQSAYRFAGSAAQTFNLDVQSVSPFFRATYQLLDPAGNDVPLTRVGNQISGKLLLAGNYSLLIGALTVAEGGDITFLPSLVADAPVAKSGLNSTQTLSIAAGGNATYTFDAPAGTRILLDGLNAVTANLNVELKAPDGTRLFTGFGLASDTQDVPRFGPAFLPQSGTYSVILRGNTATNAGDYRFRVLDLDTFGTPMALDTLVSASFPTQREAVLYTFDATAGDKLLFDGRSGGFIFGIYDEALNQLYSRGIFGAASVNEVDGVGRVVRSGRHYVLFQGDPSVPQDFSFSIQNLSTAPSLTLGQEAAGTVAANAQVNYRMQLTAGQRVRLDNLLPFATEVNYRIGNTGGRVLFDSGFQNGDSSPPGNRLIVVPESGEYFMSIQSRLPTSASFRFRIDSFDTAPLLTFDADQEVTLNPGNAAQVFRIDAAAGATIQIDNLGNSPSGIPLNWEVTGPTTQYRGGSNDGSDFTATILSAGTHYFTLSGRQNSGPLTVRFRATRTPSPVTPLSGFNTTVSLDVGINETKSYSFSAPTGRLVYLNVLKSEFKIPTHTVTLNQGETYLLRDLYGFFGPARDLTGSIITSTKPIAVFGGNRAAFVPSEFFAADHLVEQLPPTNTWGREFVTMPLVTNSTRGDRFRFLAQADDTQLTVNGTVVATLKRGEFREQVIVGPAHIVANKPILVAQYAHSQNYYRTDPGGNASFQGDPLMMIVPPFEQFLSSYTISTPVTSSILNAQRFDRNFVNIVAPAEAVGQIELNGVAIAASNFVAIGSTGLFGAQVPIALGGYELAGPLPFGVFVYGFGSFDSYGYVGGQSLSPVANVSSVVLTPPTANPPVNDAITLTARVADAVGSPLLGIRVDFEVSGVNPQRGFGFSDTNGLVQFSYTGARDGRDIVTASVGELLDDSFVDWRSGAVAPQVLITSPLDDSSVAAGTTLVATGLAIADFPLATIDLITVNGVPLTSVDVAGNFFASLFVGPGDNEYEFTAIDSNGQSTSEILTIRGTQRDPSQVDFSQFANVTGSFREVYARSSFNQSNRAFLAETAIENVGQFPTDVPLLVGITNISDPMILVRDADGTTPDGIPYYDFTGMVTGGTLNPRSLTGFLSANFFNPNEIQFTYDLVFYGKLNAPPEINSLPIVDVDLGTLYVYNVLASDPNNDKITFELVEAPAGMTIDKDKGQIRWIPSNSDQGVHSIEVRVLDSRTGTASQRYTLSARPKPANRAPIFTSQPIGTAAVGEPFPYVAKANDADNDTLTYRLLTVPAGMSIQANGAIQWQPTVEQLGLQNVVIEVSDSRGSSAQQAFALLVLSPSDNHEPVLVSTLPSAIKLSGMAHQVVAIDVENEALSYRLLESPAGMTISASGLIQWTPNASQVGSHPVAIEVLDARGGRDIQRVLLSVFDNNDPVITSSSVTTASINTNYVYQVPASDTVGDTLTYSLADAPVGMTIQSTTGLINWPVATAAYAQEPVTVEVSDSRGGLARQSFKINVTGGKSLSFNINPLFVSTPPTTASVGAQYAYHAKARDPDGDPLSFDLPLAPDGMVIDPGTGRIGWKPKADQAGMQQIVIRASDGQGGIWLQSFQVDVDASNTAPVITSSPVSNASVGNPWEYRVHVQDADDDLLTFELLNAPAGLTISPLSNADANALVRFTPTVPGSNEVVLVISDSRGGRKEQRFTVNTSATSVNVAPTIDSVARPRIPVGQPWFYLVAASDPNGDPISLSLTTAPQGMTPDSSFRSVSWTPTTAQLGSHSVVLSVSDGRGGTTTQNFQVEVVAISENHTPEIVSPPSAFRATVGEPFSYDLRAADQDGDPVEWRLIDAPHGASIDPRYGTLRWTPSLDQLGLQRFVIAVRDPLGREAQQSFSLIVSGANLAPLILSRAPSEAVADERFVYGIRAIDPENDPLSFTLTSAPLGMTIDGARGIVRWTPTISQLGTANTTVEVSDSRGNKSTQSFSLNVTQVVRNREPIITSRANFRARVDALYQYDVNAIDPEGQSISYSIASGPAGMQIDATSGLITWTPTAAQAGSHLVQVAAVDASGGRSLQRFAVLARINQAPSITSTPITSVALGGVYQYDLQVTDPEGDALSYELVTGPIGLTLDSLGRIHWETSPGAATTNPVTVRVVDAFGAIATQSFALAVTPDTTAPKVELRLSANPLALGENTVIVVQASDNVGIVDVRLTMNGQPLALDANRSATIRGDVAGLINLKATSVDASGNEGRDEVVLRIFDPADTTGPTIRLTSPQPNAVVTTLTDIVGSVTDDNLQFYRIDYGRADLVDVNQPELQDSDYRTITTSSVAAVDRVLATFDPTMLTNDNYVVRVFAQDLSGNVATKVLPLSLDGQLKLGEYNLEFTELTVPLSGIPISIRRTYNSRSANESGDFGFGWALSVVDAQIRESIPVNPLEQEVSHAATPFREGTRVYLTNADGKRVGFTFRPLPSFSLFGGGSWTPRFIPDAGVYDQLDVGSIPLRKINGAFFGAAFGEPFNPSAYRLTTKEGTVYEYGQFGGLANVHDRNGNRVEFRPDGIFSSSGPSIRFVRDPQGRISQIIDPAGNVLEYSYNAANELVQFTDQVGLSRQYSYFSTPAHFLRTIIDPNGEQVFQAQFDSQGRLTSSSNAAGATLKNEFSIADHKEVTTDPLGHKTTVFFDDRGNIERVERPGGGVVLMEYDSNDNLIKTTDEGGNIVTQTFDDRGNLIAIKNPLGESYTSQFNSTGQITSTVDPLGRSVQFVYDDSGNLIKVVNALGETTTASYDSKGRVTQSTNGKGATLRMTYGSGLKAEQIAFEPPAASFGAFASASSAPKKSFEFNTLGQTIRETDENGNVTTYEYDSIGRPVSTTDALGNKYRYLYQADRLVEVIDPLGRSTRYEYDDLGRRIREIDPAGGVKSATYNASNQVTSTTDQLGRTTSYRFRADGKLESETDPLGNVTRYEYDAVGFRTAVIDALGHRWSYLYDAMGRLVSETDPLGAKITYTYDAIGNNTLITDANGNSTRYDYNALNRLVRIVDAQGNATAIEYDANGNAIEVTDPKGRISTFEYDYRDRLIKATDPAGFVRRQSFDDYGNRISVTNEIGDTTQLFYDAANRGVSTRDSKGNTTTRTLDAFGNTIRFRNELGQTSNFEIDPLNRIKSISTTEGRIIRKEYDAVGNEIAYTDPARNTTRMEYDKLDRLIRRTDPLAHTTTIGYDAVGNQVSRIDRNGRETRYTHDTARRLTSETWLSGTNQVNNMVATFDAVGNVLSLKDSNSSLQFTYDPLNRVKTQYNAGTTGMPRVQWTAAFDSVGNLQNVTDSLGAVFARTLDGRDQTLSSMMHGGGVDPMRVDFTYSPGGQKMTETRFSDLAGLQRVGSTRWLYNEQGQLTDLTHFNALDAILVDFDYEYDALFQLTEETGTFGPKQYDYDHAGQLTSVYKAGVPTETYRYDANGNRLGPGIVIGPGNQLLSDGTFRYTYDNEGNLTEKTNITSNEKWIFSYDHRNRMTRAESRSATGTTVDVINYRYDALNRRIAVETNGSTFSTVYVGDSPWADFDGAGNLLARYLLGNNTDEMLARYRPGEGTSWYLVDRLGSVTNIANNTGAIANQISYDSYGNVLSETNPSRGDRFKFTGRELDATSRLYYNRARYYDPTTGRFVSDDPLVFNGGDANLKRYASNDPVNNTDPSGLQAISEGAALLSFVSVYADFALNYGKDEPFTFRIGCKQGACGISGATDPETKANFSVPVPGTGGNLKLGGTIGSRGVSVNATASAGPLTVTAGSDGVSASASRGPLSIGLNDKGFLGSASGSLWGFKDKASWDGKDVKYSGGLSEGPFSPSFDSSETAKIPTIPNLPNRDEFNFLVESTATGPHLLIAADIAIYVGVAEQLELIARVATAEDWEKAVEVEYEAKSTNPKAAVKAVGFATISPRNLPTPVQPGGGPSGGSTTGNTPNNNPGSSSDGDDNDSDDDNDNDSDDPNNEPDEPIEFGNGGVAGIGDFAWYDVDNDGVQDSGEVGVVGVLVRLFSPGPNGQIGGGDDLVHGERRTDLLGYYFFGNLPPGAYFIQFDIATLPTGYVPTKPNVGTDDRDSDADNQGFDRLTNLEAGEVDLSHDLGIWRP